MWTRTRSAHPRGMASFKRTVRAPFNITSHLSVSFLLFLSLSLSSVSVYVSVSALFQIKRCERFVNASLLLSLPKFLAVIFIY